MQAIIVKILIIFFYGSTPFGRNPQMLKLCGFSVFKGWTGRLRSINWSIHSGVSSLAERLTCRMIFTVWLTANGFWQNDLLTERFCHWFWQYSSVIGSDSMVLSVWFAPAERLMFEPGLLPRSLAQLAVLVCYKAPERFRNGRKRNALIMY